MKSKFSKEKYNDWLKPKILFSEKSSFFTDDVKNECENNETKVFDNLFKSKIKFNNIFLFTMNSTFKSFRNYIFSIFLPCFIIIAIYLIKTSFGISDYSNSTGQIYSLMIVPFTFCIFTASSTLMNWRDSVLLKQSKVFAIKERKIYISIFLSVLIMTFISFIICWISLFIVDIFLPIKNFTNAFANIFDFYIRNNNISEYITCIASIFLIIIFMSIYTLCIFCISGLTSIKIKSVILIQAMNFIIISLFIGLSDIAFDTNLITHNNTQIVYNFIGYLVPTKAFQWTIISLSTNTTIVPENILQTIVRPNLEIPYTFNTNETWLILPTAALTSLLWTVGIFGLSYGLNYRGMR